MSLIVRRIGPACTIQDLGRPGFLDQGLSRSGAADRQALHEGAALLEQSPELAALELSGMGGELEADAPVRIALTGAPMTASLDGTAIAWNASHRMEPGQRLRIGPVRSGTYGYLHLGGGIDAPVMLASRSVHLAAHLGRAVCDGDILTAGPDRGAAGQRIAVADRFCGGELRVVRSFQTGLFDDETLARFEATAFRRGPRANRMGMQLDSDGAGFSARGQLNILSEVITPGDIQMTGSGDPYILLPECQTTGGYPRIATVIPCDLPRAAQCPPGAPIRFRFVTLEEAVALHAAWRSDLAGLARRTEPLVRDPRDIPDLLSYQLVSGAISATGPEGD